LTRFRLILLALLFLLPFAVLIGIGSYHLWVVGYLWVWWPLLGCFALTYYTAWRWTRARGALPDTAPAAPGYWTDRDKLAWEKVDAKARSSDKVTLEEITNAKHYTDLALELAADVGAVYHPESEDPFDHLTLPEVLACVELAAADLEAMVVQYVPGVHLIRLRDVRTANKAYGMYKSGQNLYWAGAAVIDPLSAGLRYLASRFGLGTLMQRIQDNLVVWFHTAYIHQMGRYLIELNSGRLKVGVKRYREILAAHQEPPAVVTTPVPDVPATAGGVAPDLAATVPPAERKAITIAVLGAVKAGKSSLANALLGKHAATVDRLPVPSGTRYEFALPGGQPVSLMDTSGYGERVSDEDFAAAVEASRDADLILLVTGVTNPGRANDIDLLDRLREWFDGKPHLRMPPVVVAVNQVDLLTPKAEWSPPYDWLAGTRPKEVNIREATGAVAEQVGRRAANVVPVCAREGETFGIADGLVPAVVSHLDHARGSAILKAVEADVTGRPVGKVFDQLGNVASAAVGAISDWLKKKK
jgi:predicted GTPase